MRSSSPSFRSSFITLMYDESATLGIVVAAAFVYQTRSAAVGLSRDVDELKSRS